MQPNPQKSEKNILKKVKILKHFILSLFSGT